MTRRRQRVLQAELRREHRKNRLRAMEEKYDELRRLVEQEAENCEYAYNEYDELLMGFLNQYMKTVGKTLADLRANLEGKSPKRIVRDMYLRQK